MADDPVSTLPIRLPAPGELPTLDDYDSFLSGPISAEEIAAQTFGDQIGYGELMAYCYKRFGPPNGDASSDGQLICSWRLSTRMEGLYLRISIFPGKLPRYMFGIIIRKDITQRIWDERHIPMNRWLEAFKAVADEIGANIGTEEGRNLAWTTHLERGGGEPPAGFAALPDGGEGHAAEEALRLAIADLKQPIEFHDYWLTPAGALPVVRTYEA